jgi:hypothetical protein
MSTKNLPQGKGQPMRKADNITAICEPTIENMEPSTFHNGFSASPFRYHLLKLQEYNLIGPAHFHLQSYCIMFTMYFSIIMTSTLCHIFFHFTQVHK